MRTLLPLLVLLSLAAVAHADFAMPGTKPLHNTAVVQFGPELDGYRVYLLCDDHLSAVDRTPDGTVRFAAPYTRGILPRLCLVPLGAATDPTTDAEAMATAGVLRSDGLPVYRGRDWFFTAQDGTEKVFRGRVTATAVEVELVEERAVWSWPTVLVMGAVSLALALGGIWLIRRLRRKRITRTGPPPGN